MLSLIITTNKEKKFVCLDCENIVLTDDINNATLFNQDFDDELQFCLSKAREVYEGYLFRVARLDDDICDRKQVLTKHLDIGDFEL